MSGLFSSPKMPPPTPAPPPPTSASSEVADAMLSQRKRVAMMSAGRASTILTGGAGLTTEAPTAAKRLLGQ